MNKIKLSILVTSLITLSLSFNALAKEHEHSFLTKQISSKSAIKLAEETLTQCEAKGYKISTTVVDLSGQILAQLRSDGAGIHTLESSRKKAFTATSMKQPSGNLMKVIADNPIMQPLQYMNENLLFLAGGIPIQLNGNIIGGIGVGGAPNGNLDAECAEASIKKIFQL